MDSAILGVGARVGVRISRWNVGVVNSGGGRSPWMDGVEVSPPPSSELVVGAGMGWDGENRPPWREKVTWSEAERRMRAGRRLGGVREVEDRRPIEGRKCICLVGLQSRRGTGDERWSVWRDGARGLGLVSPSGLGGSRVETEGGTRWRTGLRLMAPMLVRCLAWKGLFGEHWKLGELGGGGGEALGWWWRRLTTVDDDDGATGRPGGGVGVPG